MNLTAWVFDGADDARLAAQRIDSALSAPRAECESWAVVRWDRDRRLPRSQVPSGADRQTTRTTWFWSLLLGVTFGVPALGAQVGSASGLETGPLAAAGIHDT